MPGGTDEKRDRGFKSQSGFRLGSSLGMWVQGAPHVGLEHSFFFF